MKHLDASTGYTLPALRWVAQEDLIYDPATRTLHRLGCRLAGETHRTGQPLAAWTALELIWAPRICECRPHVTLASAKPS